MKNLAADENSQATVLCPHLEGTAVCHGHSNSQICKRKLSSHKVLKDGIFKFISCSLVTVFLDPSKGMEFNV